MITKSVNIDNILGKYPSEIKYLLQVLHDIQDEYGYISKECLGAISKYFNISKAKLFSNIVFYDAFTTKKQGSIIIQVCEGTSCSFQGGKSVLEEFEELLGIKRGETTPNGLITLKTVKCTGNCGKAPVVEVNNCIYGETKVEDARTMVSAIKDEELICFPKESDDSINVINTNYDKMLLNPSKDIKHYISKGGYKGLEKAISFGRKKDTISEIKRSGLRGRSGSGFPVGDKWEVAYNLLGQKLEQGIIKDKYIIVNGDEGDPGTFMDRWIMEENPHSIIEGMIIAGYAVNASKGYIYIRDEYRKAIDEMRNAIEESKANGFLDRKICDTGFSFSCEVLRAARSYVCGEEGALLESIEGNPGIPRIKPPFPGTKGFSGQPTIVNNVETVSNIPIILNKGAEEYLKTGTQGNSGTKLISLSGKVNNRGLLEIPLGKISLKEIIYGIGGGIQGDGKFKCAQIGGPSGGFITEENLDLLVDFDSLKSKGLMLGSGGIIVFDDTTSAVDLAKHTIDFFMEESCGICTPCREGLRCINEFLQRLTEGKGNFEDIELIKKIARTAKYASRCALGASIENPIGTLLKHFHKEFTELIV